MKDVSRRSLWEWTTAYERVPKALDEQERMVLAGADLDAFLGTVMHPPEPTQKLVTALRRLAKPQES